MWKFKRSSRRTDAARMLSDAAKRTKAKLRRTLWSFQFRTLFLSRRTSHCYFLFIFSDQQDDWNWTDLDWKWTLELSSVARGNRPAVTGERGQLVDTHQPHCFVLFSFLIVSCLRRFKRKGCCVLIGTEIGRGVDGGAQYLSVCSTVTVPAKSDCVLTC